MQMQRFLDAYGDVRNGADFMVRHPLVRHFLYSSGVQECAEAGLYWLLDVIGTEGVDYMRKRVHESNFMIIYFDVKDSKATIKGAMSDSDPTEWMSEVAWTDCEDGNWTFYMQYDGQKYALILPSEY